MIVFDLDGTLSLNEHRQHFIRLSPGVKKDWNAFSNACDLDEPNWPIIETLRLWHSTLRPVEIWSGRSMSVELKTKDWLGEQGLGSIPLKMRPIGDYQTDMDLKRDWYDTAPIKPVLVFEDRHRVVDMWRSLGVICCQVAQGDF